jgi:hypothetical protein
MYRMFMDRPRRALQCRGGPAMRKRQTHEVANGSRRPDHQPEKDLFVAGAAELRSCPTDATSWGRSRHAVRVFPAMPLPDGMPRQSSRRADPVETLKPPFGRTTRKILTQLSHLSTVLKARGAARSAQRGRDSDNVRFTLSSCAVASAGAGRKSSITRARPKQPHHVSRTFSTPSPT